MEVKVFQMQSENEAGSHVDVLVQEKRNSIANALEMYVPALVVIYR